MQNSLHRVLNMSIYSTPVNNLYYSLVFSLSLKINNSKIPSCALVLDKTCALNSMLPLMGSFFLSKTMFLATLKANRASRDKNS